MAESGKGAVAVAEPVAARQTAVQTQSPEHEGGLAGLTAPLTSRTLAWVPPPDPSTPQRSLLHTGPVTLTGEWNTEQIAPVIRLLGELLPQLDISGHPFELKITTRSESLKQRGAHGSAGNNTIELHTEDALHESTRQRYLLAHEAAHIAQQRRSTHPEESLVEAEIEAHEIASAFASHRRVLPPRHSAPAARTMFDVDLEATLKEQVLRSRVTEIEYVKKQLRGWVSADDVHRTLLTLQSVDFFVARAIMQNVEPAMRRKLVDHLDGNDAIRFRPEVFATYAAMESEEVRHFGAELFDKVDLHELTPHEQYAAYSVLQKFPKKGEELRGTKNEFAIAVILSSKLTNEAISDEQLQKANDQEGQAEKKNASGTQPLSPKEQADYARVADLLSKRFFFFPPSQSKVREALQLLSHYRPQPDRMRLLAIKLDKAGLLDRLVEHAPVKSLIQEQLTESSAGGQSSQNQSGPVLLPTFLTLVSFRPAYRNIALAEDLSRQTFFRKWISNIGSEQAFLALQLIKSAPDRMKESFAADTNGDFLNGIGGELGDELRENEGVNLYGGGLHQEDRAKIEAALLDESLWSEKRLPELNARIRMAHAANERRFVFEQSAKFRAWQREGLLPLVEKYSLYNPEATGPDGKRAPRTTFVAPDSAARMKDRSFLGALWNILGTVKIRNNGIEITDLDLLDVQRLFGGNIKGLELAGSKNKAAASPQANRIQQFIWNTDTRAFHMEAALLEIASVHRVGATRIDAGAGTVSGIRLNGILDADKNLKNITASVDRIQLSDIAVTMAGSIATIAEIEIASLELRLGAALDFSTLPKVEIAGRSHFGIPIFGPLLNPIITFCTFASHAYRGSNAMIKALEDMPQSGLRIGSVKARSIYLSSGDHVESLEVAGVEARAGSTLDGYQAELRAATKALTPLLGKAADDLKLADPAEREARQAALQRMQKRMDALNSAIAALDLDRAALKDLEAKEKKDTLTPAESERIKELRRGGALLSVASVQISGVGGQLSADSISVSDVQGTGRTSGEKTKPVLAGKTTSADFRVTAGCFTALNAGWKSAPEDSAVLGAQVDKLKTQIEKATAAGEQTAPLQVKLQLLQGRLRDTIVYEQFAERGIATLTPQEAAQYRLLIQKLSDTSSISADKVEAHDLALSVSTDAFATTGGVSAKLLSITGVHYRRTETSLKQEEAQLDAVEHPTPAQQARLQDLQGALTELASLRFRVAENAVALEKARGTTDEAALREQQSQLEAGLRSWSQDQRVAESVTLTGPHVTVKTAGGLIGGDKSFDELMDDGLHISGGFEKLEIRKPQFANSSGGVTTDTKADDITAGPFEGKFDISSSGVGVENLSLGSLDVTGLNYESSEQSVKGSGNISLRGLLITKARVVYEEEVSAPTKDAKDTTANDKKSEPKRKATTLHCDELRIASISGNALAFSKKMDDGQTLNVKVPHGSLLAIGLKNFSLALPADGGALQYEGHAELGKTEIAGLNGKLGRSLEATASIRAGLISADFAAGGKTLVNLNDFNVLNAHLHQSGKGADSTDVQFEITHVGGKVALNADGNIDIDLKPTIGVQVKTLHWKSGTKELTSNKPVTLESMDLHATLHKLPDGTLRDVTVRSMHIPLITAEALRYQDAPIDLSLDQTLADKDKKAFSIRDLELNNFIYSPKKGIVSGAIATKDITAAVQGDFADQIKGGLRVDAKSISAHFYQDGAFSSDIDGLSAKFKGSALGAGLDLNLDGFNAHVYMTDSSIVVQNLGIKTLNLDYLNFDSPDYRVSLPQGAGHAQLKALSADFTILLKPPPKPGSVPPGTEPPSRLQAVSITKLHIDEINAAGLELEIKDKPVGDAKAGPSTLVRLPNGKPMTLSGIDLIGPEVPQGGFLIEQKADGSKSFLGGLKVERAELQQLQVAMKNSFQLRTAIHAGGMRVDFLSGGKKRVSVQTLSVEDLNVLLGDKATGEAAQFAENFTDPGTGITVNVASAHIAPDPLKRDEPPLVVDPDGHASLSQLVIDDASFNIPDIMEAIKSKPATAGAKDAPPAGPAMDLQDWKFVDTLQGWVRADVNVEFGTTWNFPLQLEVKDGTVRAFDAFETLTGASIGVFFKLELQDNKLALVLDESKLPKDEYAGIYTPLTPDKFNLLEIPLTKAEAEQAGHGVVPLAALRKAQLAKSGVEIKDMISPPDASKKKSDEPTMIPARVSASIDTDLYTAGQSVIDLGPAGKIIVGPGGMPGLGHLKIKGDLKPGQENAIDIALGYATVGLENFKVAGVGLNMGQLAIEGVRDTTLSFAKGEAIPKSLKGHITKATASDVNIDFTKLMQKKPDPAKGDKP